MKWLVQKPIELYWRVIEPSRRRRCLYRESCSHHVHRITGEHGALKGLLALFHRARRCRKGYHVTFDAYLKPHLTLADGTMIGVEEASPSAVTMLNDADDVIRLHLSPSK
ncbi:MAG: membrane protein insertion efficiency factor YidD [Candidatus Eremiobacteraeota bacterium]|nr:membrane protein insertion efficiency factor YidD [Candidatus Eremiobacteraeota bacterium]